MVMLDFELDLWGGAWGSQHAILPGGGRLAVISPDCFYAVVEAGGMSFAHRFSRNNMGAATPPASIGSPYQAWRYTGTVRLASFDADPLAPVADYGLDVGATDVAASVGGVFGASYHGGETILAQQVKIDGATYDPSLAGSFAAALEVEGQSSVSWGGAQTMDRTFSVVAGSDGSIMETQSLTSTATATSVYVGMTIAAGSGYSIGYLGRGGSELAFPIFEGTNYLGLEGDVRLVDPGTGRWTRSISNAPSRPGFRQSYILRSAALARSKLYHEFNSGVIGTVTGVERRIEFGEGKTGSPAFANLLANGDFSGGLAGWQATHNAAGVSLAGNALQLSRHASLDTRVNCAVSCTVGKLYMLAGRLVSGTAPVNAARLHLGNAANGSTSGALGFTFIQAGFLSMLFVATQPTHYIMPVLSPGTAGQTAILDDFCVYAID